MTLTKPVTCVRCRRPQGPILDGWQHSLIGLLCPKCWAAAAPESAEYWQRWEAGAAKERKRQARKPYRTTAMGGEG